MKKKVTFGIIFCLTVSFVLQATPPARKDTARAKSSGVELRNWYVTGPPAGTFYARPLTPEAGSIHVNRDTMIESYTPTELVRQIFLKTYTPTDMARIQNVRHVGWNWNPVTQQKVTTPASTRRTDDGGGWWGQANPSVYDPDERSLLYFTKGTASPDKFDMEKGILLTTGPGLRTEGPNNTHHGLSDGFRNDGTLGRHTASYTGNSISVNSITSPKHKYRPGVSGWTPDYSFDRDLDGLTGDAVAWTTCGSVLEFDFQPVINQASFNYIFASEEYPEGVYLSNDVFGFFVSGPFDEPPGHDIENTSAQWSIENPTGYSNEYTRIHADSVYYRYNIARLPDNNPVGIDYVNWGSIKSYWCAIVPYGCGIWSEFYKDDPSLSPPYGSYELHPTLKTDPSAQLTSGQASYWGYKNFAIYAGSPYTSDPTPMGNSPYSGTYYYAVPTNPHLFRYIYQDDPTMEYDGYTVKMRAVADKLIPGKWYHLKLAIANTAQRDPVTGYIDFDRNHGSGVFLSNLDLGKIEGDIEYPYLYTAFDYKGQDENGNYYLFSHDNPNTLRTDCDDYRMNIHIDTVAAENSLTIFISYINIAPEAVQTSGGAKLFPNDTLKLAGKLDTLRHYDFKLSTNYAGFENGQYVGLVISLQGGNSDTVFYGPLYSHATYSPFFSTPTTLYAGMINLNTKYGSPQLHRSADDGETWQLASEPFNILDIKRVIELGYVLMREPNSGYILDTIKVRNSSPPIPDITRMVIVPAIEDVTTSPGPGEYHILSQEDFVLRLTPNPNSPRANMTPVLSTDRKLLSDTEGVSMNSMRDGSYTYTIYNIQETVNITIEFISSTGSETVKRNTIWASGQQLHIVSSESGVATVYTLAGTVFKTIPHTGGDTTTTVLPAGVYIISFNGKSYKILVNRK
ncbi:MAG: choice-of-anchor L domain-containing protein [Tannerella sp.]|jgi:hypothetical protein|nr:choice-of-anchor L domain-containing protein [Tannerella sp.]